MADFRRILLIKPSSLGDIIHALPALSALRRRFPQAHITWLVKREWAQIVEGHPDLNEVIAADLRWPSWPRLVARLRRAQYDLVIDLQGLLRSGLLTQLTGASVRIGFAAGREGSRWCYTDRVVLAGSESLAWRLIPVHAVDRNLALVAHVGADVTRPRFVFPDLTQEDRRVTQMLGDHGIRPGDRMIAVAPVDRHRVRSWPLERFAEAAAQLAALWQVKVVVLGTSGQREIVQPFVRRMSSGVVDLVGKTTIRELAAMLRRATLLLANDSAPLHLASALGVPVVGLFGPTSVVRARPYGDRHRIVRIDLPCSPCDRRICSNAIQYECLTGIEVAQVVAAARTLVESSGADH
ncbi:lipopolysaccharide heptosyltransferase II [Nitrospira sp. NS4]|uniref:lipopolysaccharide heptosyltransferase II n=1 Tax=Nitrospira sp. NS4 TaxID=3414498 RepID=UPI003C2D2638